MARKERKKLLHSKLGGGGKESKERHKWHELSTEKEVTYLCLSLAHRLYASLQKSKHPHYLT